LILLLVLSCVVDPCMQTMVILVLDLCCVVRWRLFLRYVLEVFIFVFVRCLAFLGHLAGVYACTVLSRLDLNTWDPKCTGK
jgi:hypothetical protein